MARTSVNRYLLDKAMDHIDHALGRPVNPMAESYRNHYAINANSNAAKEFDASPYWSRQSYEAPGRMVFYHVTAAGRAALAQHLKDIGDKHRIFEVWFEGHPTKIAAVSAAKAKYSIWLDISDTWSELTFARFCRSASVRLADGRVCSDGD